MQIEYRSADGRLDRLPALTADVAELPKPLRKYPRERLSFFHQQHAELRRPCLLRAYNERQRSGRAREHYDEITASHTINLTAPSHRAIPHKASNPRCSPLRPAQHFRFDHAWRSTCVSISLRSIPKSIGLVKSASAPLSSALRLVSASP